MEFRRGVRNSLLLEIKQLKKQLERDEESVGLLKHSTMSPEFVTEQIKRVVSNRTDRTGTGKSSGKKTI